MKTLYLDIPSGISGDMFLGAMLDLGVNYDQLEADLARLNLEGYHLHARKKSVNGIHGTKFDVHLATGHHHSHEHGHSHGHQADHHHHDEAEHEHHHPHGHAHAHHEEHDPHHDSDHAEVRAFADIKRLILKSSLSAWAKEKSLAVFQRIANAEGKVHGCKPDKVHFHEVGAIDSIIDIVGACLALEQLGKPRVLAAPVVEGTGWIHCAHGRMSIPAPATLEILGARNIPLSQCDEPHELVTPTGAALLAEFVEAFGPMTALVAEKIGYGLGTRQLKTRTNCLRAILTTIPSSRVSPKCALDWETDRVAVLETNLDDINCEVLGHFMDLALSEGVLEVFHTPIQMKKNRPGTLLTILCPENDADRFAELMLRHTTAFGIRIGIASRRKLPRQFVKVTTPFGEVEVKQGCLDGKVIQSAPEYESCKKAAAQSKVPIKEVYAAALKASVPRASRRS